jgi:hypothetical protein
MSIHLSFSFFLTVSNTGPTPITGEDSSLSLLFARKGSNGVKLQCQQLSKYTNEQNKQHIRIEISGSHGGDYEDGCLLESCVVQSGRN